MGAPHRRERIWIVAYPEYDGRNKTEKNRKYRQDESEKQTGKKHLINEFEGANLLRRKGFAKQAEDVADAGLQRPQKHEKQAARIEQCSESERDVSYASSVGVNEQQNGIQQKCEKHEGRSLSMYAKKFPTPQCRDWKGKSQRGADPKNRDCLPNAIQDTGQLNPTWVCWLMGYPLNWMED